MKNIARIIVLCAVFAAAVMSCAKEEQVTAISLSETYVVLPVPGDTVRLVASVYPDGASGEGMEWRSSDEAVATVTDGIVRASGYGEAVVTVSKDGCEAVCYVFVRKTDVEQIALNKKEITVIKGQEEQLRAILSPTGADESLVSWLSADPSVASVSQSGVVKGITPGTTQVKAYVGELYAECTVVVEGVPAESIELSVDEAEMFVGNEFVVTASVYPYNADYEPEWSSSSTSSVTVDANGRIRAVAQGESVISLKAGDATASCRVTVLDGRPAKIGDVYYSDGTWSPLPDDRKTAIGVVFWAGDPGTDDPTLRKDHPECVNGLVVSTDYYTSNWQTNFSEGNISVGDWVASNRPDLADTRTEMADGGSINYMVGYNNTCAMVAFNEDPANSQWPLDVVAKLMEHRNKVTAPEKSSGWYIPSVVEASLARNGEVDCKVYEIWKHNEAADVLEVVNIQMARVEEASLISLLEHWWTSNESDETIAYAFTLYNGAVTKAQKVTKPAMGLRFILAF